MLTGRYKKVIFSLYKSHTMSDAAEGVAGDETKVGGRASILKRPVFIVGAAACRLLIWYSMHTFVGAITHFSTGPNGTPVPELFGAAAARSGAEGCQRPKALPAGLVAIRDEVRLLAYVVDDRGPKSAVAYLTDGRRVSWRRIVGDALG
jgi:hypothetical protein